jgi:hypothetical protein
VAGEEPMLKNLMICTDITKKSEIGWECSTCGGEKRRIQGFVMET